MSLEPITHISLNLGPNMGTTDFMVGIRVVPAGRNGNEVYARTLNTGEPDGGESILLNVGDELIFPAGNLRITLRDVDKYAEVQPTGYAAITNTVWTWLQMPPPKSGAFFHYMLSTARRLDQAHALCVQILQELDALPEERGITRRTRLFNALANSESMCLALGRAITMIMNAGNKIQVKTAVHPDLKNLGERATAIRDAFEHIDERAFGKARRETSTDALSIFNQADLASDRVLRYAKHSLSLPLDVLPNLVKARRFVYDAISEPGDIKTVNVPVFGRTMKGDYTLGETPPVRDRDHRGRTEMTQKPEESRILSGLQYQINARAVPNLRLPKSTNPINFSAERQNGLSSNAWGVKVGKRGDIYIYCRDHMKELKISLHESGMQLVAFKEESGIKMTGNSRLWNRWQEPEHHDDSSLTPTFKLLLPSWGLGLSQDTRATNRRVWSKNHITIAATEDPIATTVSFIIKDSEVDLTPGPGEFWDFLPIGALDARQGKKLWICVEYRGEGTMKEFVKEVITDVNRNPKMIEELKKPSSGARLGLCAGGFDSERVAYMLPFPARVEQDDTGTPYRFAPPFDD